MARKPSRTRPGKKTSERRLTMKQRKTLKGVAAGKPMLQAARDAGYTEASAHSVPYRNGALRAALASLLDEAGLTDAHLMKRLKELTDARATKFFAHEGKVKDQRTVVDHDARARGIDLACKLKALYPPRGDEDRMASPPAVSVHFHLSAGSVYKDITPRRREREFRCPQRPRPTCLCPSVPGSPGTSGPRQRA